MPIYEFECPDCGHRFDQLMRLSDPDPTECARCGGTRVRRRVSAPQFRLAGGGWYETDFKRDKDKRRNLAGDGEASPAEAKPADTKPDTAAKPESQPAAKPAAAASPVQSGSR